MFNAATAYRGGSAQFELLQCVNMNEANYYLTIIAIHSKWYIQKHVSICNYHQPTHVTVFMYLHVFAIYQHV